MYWGGVVPPTTVLWPLDPHTEAKHRIYTRYLKAWFPILLSQGRGVTYAEGFAGPGQYTGGEPGSPILALRTLLAGRRRATPAAPAYFLLSDADKKRCEYLRDRLIGELGTLDPAALRRRGLVVDVREGQCEGVIPQMFRDHQVIDRPLLAIFDTWGSAVAFDLLSRIARVRGAEVIVTIQPQHFARFAADPEHFGDTIFGSTVWREVQAQQSGRKAAYIQTQYRRTINEAGFRYVLDFELADEGSHLLYLVYGTNHPTGITKMKDAMWSVDAVNGVGYRDPRDPDQQMLDIQIEPQTAPLRRLVLDHLATQPAHSATVNAVTEFVLHHTIYKPSHARSVVTALLASGDLHQLTPGRLTPTTTVTLVQARLL
jgi:three-Cys-motif partner protein